MEKPHKKLDLWKLAMELVIQVYEATDRFPRDERFSITDQIRRAAINVAEGAARQTKKEFANHLHIAQGSLSELDTSLSSQAGSVSWKRTSGSDLMNRWFVSTK